MSKCLTFGLVAVLSAAAAASESQPRRPFAVDDLFRLQALGDVRMSPDGTAIAVVVQRAWSDPAAFRPYDMLGNDHADIWILSADGGPAKNITHGAAEGVGYWNPVWSPDSRRLALLSNQGGDNVRVYVWDKDSERLRRLTDRGVNLRAGTAAAGSWNPLQWADSRRLLVAVLPAGEQPVEFRLRKQTQRLASAGWTQAARGRQPARSVLEGGITAGQTERADQLLLIDVASGRARVLAEAGIRHVLLSPDREHVAIITQGPPPAPRPGTPLPSASAGPSRLAIGSLREGAEVRWVEAVRNPAVGFGTNPHRWSPKGTSLAVVASGTPAPGSVGGTFVVSPRDGSVRRVAEKLTVSAIAWTESEQLLVRARGAGNSERADWWSIPSSPGEPRNVTEALSAAPAELVRTRRPGEMLGLSEGVLWRLDLESGSHHRLHETPGVNASVIVWPGEEERVAAPVSSMIVRERQGDATLLLLVDVTASGADVSPVPQPAPASTVAGFHPGRRLVVFVAPRHPDGSFLWTAAAGSAEFSRRLALNPHLPDVETSEPSLIDYTSADGKDLKGLVLLPAGYKRGTRYPLVTWVYPGFVVRDAATSFWINKNQAHVDNLHVLAGQGYAVLIPSMPAGDAPRDPYRELQAGVLPAVDRLVELGIADADRVGLLGQSAGGFATFGLITQTPRFKAAIAISGYANLTSNYGTFRGDERYTDAVDDKLTQVRFSEGSVIGMGASPWEDPDRYIRNSPAFFLDRVQTPLLILHGDIDFVPVQQAEEVFTGLYRLGKRVRFVRYWGEGHGVTDSAANVRDRWREILDWFATHLRDAR